MITPGVPSKKKTTAESTPPRKLPRQNLDFRNVSAPTIVTAMVIPVVRDKLILLRERSLATITWAFPLPLRFMEDFLMSLPNSFPAKGLIAMSAPIGI
jgi:hypothetical protein